MTVPDCHPAVLNGSRLPINPLKACLLVALQKRGQSRDWHGNSPNHGEQTLSTHVSRGLSGMLRPTLVGMRWVSFLLQVHQPLAMINSGVFRVLGIHRTYSSLPWIFARIGDHPLAG